MNATQLLSSVTKDEERWHEIIRTVDGFLDIKEEWHNAEEPVWLPFSHVETLCCVQQLEDELKPHLDHGRGFSAITLDNKAMVIRATGQQLYTLEGE